jgi:hypothetical protein
MHNAHSQGIAYMVLYCTTLTNSMCVSTISCGILCTANEGSVRIQYKCLVPIYVFPEMKLLFSKTGL